MNTKWNVRSKRLLFAAMMGALFIGCSKEQLPPISVDETEGVGMPKVPPFFLSYGSTAGTYKVNLWNASCVDPWGSAQPNPRCEAPNSLLIGTAPSYMRATQGSCAIDANYLRLQRGNNAGTVNTWGPWYYIWPQWGPAASVRKGLKLRVKKTSPLLGHDYQLGAYYDAPSNTWSYNASNTNFEVQVLTGIPTDLCPPRE